MKPPFVIQNPWETLKQFTDARIALGRAGSSLPTHEMLKFQMEHAMARDAVHLPLNGSELLGEIKTHLSRASELSARADLQKWIDQTITLNSQAENRDQYLQRPDLGRCLHSAGIDELKRSAGDFDLAICLVDGLSSIAMMRNVAPFLVEWLPSLDPSISLAPLTLVMQGRVAIGDAVAQTLNAKQVLVLIGERPGLSSPDSMGLYLTYAPNATTTDADRNCVSNIRLGGLSYPDAAHKAHYLINESRRLQLSGVQLKERSEVVDNTLTSAKSFLTAR